MLSRGQVPACGEPLPPHPKARYWLNIVEASMQILSPVKSIWVYGRRQPQSTKNA